MEHVQLFVVLDKLHAVDLAVFIHIIREAGKVPTLPAVHCRRLISGLHSKAVAWTREHCANY